jgi:hypothetical protein
MRDDAARERSDRDIIRRWQLAILTFAITRHDAEQAVVARLARRLDSIGTGPRGVPAFFARMSTEVCGAIAAAHSPQSTEVLQRFVCWVDEPRLMAALLGATGLDQCHWRPDGRGDSSTGTAHVPRGPDYEVVVEQDKNGIAWQWELRRNGIPLAARLREEGFKSERTAAASGKVALQDFIDRLRMEATQRGFAPRK